jgi:hypothetical protein
MSPSILLHCFQLVVLLVLRMKSSFSVGDMRLKGSYPGKLNLGYGNLTIEEIDEDEADGIHFTETVKLGQKGQTIQAHLMP